MKPIKPQTLNRVLIVDDDRVQLEILENYFQRRHVRHIARAIDGIDAQDQIDKNLWPFDLIVSDVNMPHFDGIALLNHLSRVHYTGHLLIMSGADQATIQLTDRIARNGTFNYLGFINKPTSMLKLDVMIGNPSAEIRQAASRAM